MREVLVAHAGSFGGRPPKLLSGFMTKKFSGLTLAMRPQVLNCGRENPLRRLRTACVAMYHVPWTRYPGDPVLWTGLVAGSKASLGLAIIVHFVHRLIPLLL